MGFSRVYFTICLREVAPVSCPKSTVLWMAKEENRRVSFVRASRHIPNKHTADVIQDFLGGGGGFKYFLCSSLFGEDSHFD